MWPTVWVFFLQPANKNRPEREGNPGPRPAAAPNKHEKTQKNENTFLRETIVPIISGRVWLDELGRYC